MTTIAGGAVVVAFAGTLIGFGASAKSRDTIFPNVNVAGVDIGGMTKNEALQALRSEDLEFASSDVTATVVFPNEEELTVSGEEAGLSLDIDSAVDLAWNYGRRGGFVSNGINLLRAKTVDYEITPNENDIDDASVREIVDAFTKDYNASLAKDSCKISKNEIVLVKGAGTSLANTDEVLALMVDALSESRETGEPVSVNYEIPPSESEIDLEALYKTVFVEPKNAEYDPETGEPTKHVDGVSFDKVKAAKLIKNAAAGDTIRIPLIKTEPEITSDKLSELLFSDVLSECTTYVHGTWNRHHNIELASSAMNGVVLNPGDVFSFNGVVGERTYAKGYADATAYIGGKSVPDVGGGICQVASTLYACVLYADLEEVERYNHMFEVEYHMLGIDATVAWPDVDYRFRNSTDYPILVESYVSGDYITVRLYGTKTTTNYIRLDYDVVSVENFATIRKEDPSIPAGTEQVDSYGHTGYVVDTYRYLYNENGELLEYNLIARNVYDKCDYVVLVPPKGTDPTTPPEDDPTAPPEEPTTPPEDDPTTPPEEPTTPPDEPTTPPEESATGE